MKRAVLSIAISLLCAISMSAQDGLRFLGVPVGGTFQNCSQALKKAGFRKDRMEPRMMSGKYRGTPVSLMLACDDVSSSDVSMFVLTYSSRPDWSSTVALYETVRMMLTSEYGSPSLVQDEYDFPYTESDGFRAIENGKCRFVTSYSIYPGGTTDDGLSAAARKRTSVAAVGEITLTISDDKKVRVFFRPL